MCPHRTRHRLASNPLLPPPRRRGVGNVIVTLPRLARLRSVLARVRICYRNIHRKRPFSTKSGTGSRGHQPRTYKTTAQQKVTQVCLCSHYMLPASNVVGTFHALSRLGRYNVFCGQLIDAKTGSIAEDADTPGPRQHSLVSWPSLRCLAWQIGNRRSGENLIELGSAFPHSFRISVGRYVSVP